MSGAGRLPSSGTQRRRYSPSGSNLRLCSDRVEDPEVGSCVGAGAGDPLPITDVLGDVAVDEERPEVPLTFAPVDEEILDEERCRDHADTVVHPPFGEELSHAGIDDGITGPALSPRGEPLRVVPPADAGKLAADRLRRRRGKGNEGVGVEVAPRQLPDECFPAGGADAHLVDEQPRRDRAELEIDREPGSAIEVGTIPERPVVVDVVEKALEAISRAGFPGWV